MQIKTCLRQPLLDNRRRELEYYLNRHLFYRHLFFADSYRLWPQAFRQFRCNIRQEVSDQSTPDIIQDIKRLRLLQGLNCRVFIRDDLHYLRYGVDSPFQLAQLLQKHDLRTWLAGSLVWGFRLERPRRALLRGVKTEMQPRQFSSQRQRDVDRSPPPSAAASMLPGHAGSFHHRQITLHCLLLADANAQQCRILSQLRSLY